MAEEVKKLAEESLQAAKQISGLIYMIQNKTDLAVKAMDENVKLVEHGNQVILAGAKMFNQIVSSVDNAYRQFEEVAATIEEMGRSTEMITKTITEIGRITQQFTYSVQDMGASTEEQSASTEQISATVRSIANLAEKLGQAVNKFKV